MLRRAATAASCHRACAGGAECELGRPERTLEQPESADAVRLGAGMLCVLAALVLELLVGIARDSLDAADWAARGMSADLIQTDQTLAACGPEATPIRGLLRRYAGPC